MARQCQWNSRQNLPQWQDISTVLTFKKDGGICLIFAKVPATPLTQKRSRDACSLGLEQAH